MDSLREDSCGFRATFSHPGGEEGNFGNAIDHVQLLCLCDLRMPQVFSVVKITLEIQLMMFQVKVSQLHFSSNPFRWVSFKKRPTCDTTFQLRLWQIVHSPTRKSKKHLSYPPRPKTHQQHIVDLTVDPNLRTHALPSALLTSPVPHLFTMLTLPHTVWRPQTVPHHSRERPRGCVCTVSNESDVAHESVAVSWNMWSLAMFAPLPLQKACASPRGAGCCLTYSRVWL